MEQPNSNNAAAPHVNAVNQGEADVGGQEGPINSWQDLFCVGLDRGHCATIPIFTKRNKFKYTVYKFEQK